MTCVSAEFKRRVYQHLYLNFTAAPHDGTPLFLLIYGPPGEGKSFQLRQILRELDVDRHDLDSTAVEDPSAGRPDREIIRRFDDAARVIAGTGRAACVVMEDVHLLLGRYENTQYTMNLQHVISQLMRFADTMGNTYASSRVPVFMTANDTTVLAQPLIRSGRARPFRWAPSLAEKRTILAPVLPELNDSELTSLTSRYRDKPISFFSQLRQEVHDDFLHDVILADDPEGRLRRAIKVGHVDRPRISVTFKVLLDAAERLANEAKGGVYLEVRK